MVAKKKADSAKKVVKKATTHKTTKTASSEVVHPEHHHILQKVEEVVEEKMHQVLKHVNKDEAEHVLHDFLGSFHGAQRQDYFMFALGVFFLVWALIELWAVVWGVILLLLALLLLNMFFGRK